MAEEQQTASLRAIRIEFNTWRDERECECCFDHHTGLNVGCDNKPIWTSGHLSCSINYNWEHLIPLILTSLGIVGVFSSDTCDEEEDADRLICRTESARGEWVIERQVEFSGDEPSQTGLGYLREVLEIAGFKPSFFVNGRERI